MSKNTFKHKYHKYKSKYLKLERKIGGFKMKGGDFEFTIGDRVEIIDKDLVGTILTIDSFKKPDTDTWIYRVKADNGLEYKVSKKELRLSGSATGKLPEEVTPIL